MLYIVGAGPGDPGLLTLRGAELLRAADVVIYAGSLVNPALLDLTKPGCQLHNSAGMTLDEIVAVVGRSHRAGQTVVRLSSGDPSLYGAVREQIDRCRDLGIPLEVVPGVSSLGAAAAALGVQYTLPGVSQTLILTRLAGRTPVPDAESLAALAGHQASMAIFLSVHRIERVVAQLRAAYPAETPVAVVYKASWPEQEIVRGTLGDIAAAVKDRGITKTALILVDGFLGDDYELSRLYNPAFSHGCRTAKPAQGQTPAAGPAAGSAGERR